MINETLGCLTINGKNLSNDNTQLENIINFKKNISNIAIFQTGV